MKNSKIKTSVIVLCIDIILIFVVGLFYIFFISDNREPFIISSAKTFGFPNPFIIIYTETNTINPGLSFNILQFIINLLVYGPIAIIIYFISTRLYK